MLLWCFVLSSKFTWPFAFLLLILANIYLSYWRWLGKPTDTNQQLQLQTERGIQLHFSKREKLLIMNSLAALTISTLLMWSFLATKASGLCSMKLAGLQWIIKIVSYSCQLVVGRVFVIRSATSMFLFSIFLSVAWCQDLEHCIKITIFAASSNTAPRCHCCSMPIVVAYPGSDRGINIQVCDTGSILKFSANSRSGICSNPRAQVNTMWSL
jgi:hypothetical protein